MRALMFSLCGFLLFPIFTVLKPCGILDSWSQDVTEQLFWAYLVFGSGLLLMLIGAVLAVIGLCRRKQKRLNIAALLLLVLWPAVCMLLQGLCF